MAKRSDFPRRKNDSYDTPANLVPPLLRHLPPRFTYCEPCAGNGSLIKALSPKGVCTSAYDIEPRSSDVTEMNALFLKSTDADYIITNPPWTRQLLHPMILQFSAIKPTWLLFDSGWMHTLQAIPYLPFLSKVVSIGRAKWIPESKHQGVDDCAWYLFDANTIGRTQFFGRVKDES